MPARPTSEVVHARRGPYAGEGRAGGVRARVGDRDERLTRHRGGSRRLNRRRCRPRCLPDRAPGRGGTPRLRLLPRHRTRRLVPQLCDEVIEVVDGERRRPADARSLGNPVRVIGRQPDGGRSLGARSTQNSSGSTPSTSRPSVSRYQTTIASKSRTCTVTIIMRSMGTHASQLIVGRRDSGGSART